MTIGDQLSGEPPFKKTLFKQLSNFDLAIQI